MHNQHTNLANILLAADLIQPQQLQLAEQLAQQQQQRLLSVLIAHEMVAAQDICGACADYYKLKQVDVTTLSLHQLPIQFIDSERCKNNLILPIALIDGHLHIALCDPEDLPLLENIHFRTGLPVQAVFADYTQLSNLINSYLNQQHFTSSTPIIVVVEQILTDAILHCASDIHIEPTAQQLRIRLRIDGLLHQIATLSIEQAKAIVSRFKVMANLDIAEQRRPQDGRFTFKTKQGQIRDCRLSTCPTLLGEKVVIRLLDSNQQLLNIDELGFNHFAKQQLLHALQQPQGLILVTGPTGSGKTQTLYTALQQLNQLQSNIITIEDPVEIQLPGINQVHVNDKADLHFATALRAFMRQDPDIIMVGEIRDQETAQTAIRAAQTGHLVLSTLHTNSAVETITRLVSMGIPSYQLVGSLSLIIAQRLARQLCHHCKQSYVIQSHELPLSTSRTSSASEPLTLFRPQGCQYCLRGYKGRCGIFEIMLITPPLQQLILNTTQVDLLLQQAQQAGMQSLWDAALDKVCNGVTSLQEIYRVIYHEQ